MCVREKQRRARAAARNASERSHFAASHSHAASIVSAGGAHAQAEIEQPSPQITVSKRARELRPQFGCRRRDLGRWCDLECIRRRPPHRSARRATQRIDRESASESGETRDGPAGEAHRLSLRLSRSFRPCGRFRRLGHRQQPPPAEQRRQVSTASPCPGRPGAAPPPRIVQRVCAQGGGVGRAGAPSTRRVGLSRA